MKGAACLENPNPARVVITVRINFCSPQGKGLHYNLSLEVVLQQVSGVVTAAEN